jgi:hypothetical protein
MVPTGGVAGGGRSGQEVRDWNPESPPLRHTGRKDVMEEEKGMYTTYHLRADELNEEIVQTLKKTYQQNEIVILPIDAYAEVEKVRHNMAFTEKLQQRIKALDEGNGIVKTMVELEAMENE